MKPNQNLTDAVNLLAEYVAEHLPVGWMIELQMASDEASVTLYDWEGDFVPDATSGDDSAIAEMCDYAKEHESECD